MNKFLKSYSPRMMLGISSRSGSAMLIALSDRFPLLVTMIVVITGINDGPAATVLPNRAEFLRFRGSLLVDTLFHAIPGSTDYRRCDRGAASHGKHIVPTPISRRALLKTPIIMTIMTSSDKFFVEPDRPDESMIGEISMIVVR